LYIGKCKMYLYSLIGFRTRSILGPLTLVSSAYTSDDFQKAALPQTGS